MTTSSRMTKTEYKQILRALNLTIIGASAAFGYSPRQTYRYSTGRGRIPSPVAKLLRLAARNRLTPEQIAAL